VGIFARLANSQNLEREELTFTDVVIALVKGSYIGFYNIDLTGIEQINFIATAPKSQLNAAGAL
jgi:hypothetical protein